MQIVKPILITGVAGYIGSFIRSQAQTKGIPVVGADVAYGQNILDLTKRDIQDCQYIIHLAAIVGTEACKKTPGEALRTNLEGTMHLCHIAGDIPIYFTNTNIGYPKGNSDETAELKSENVYGRTKIEAERVILDHGGVSLRLASVFGYSPKMRDDLLVHYLVKEFVAGKPASFFDLDSMRNFVSIRDVCRLLLDPIDLKRGEAYNVALDEHMTKRGVIKVIEQFTGRKFDWEEGEQKDPDNRDYYLSTKKIHDDTGFKAVWTIKDELPRLVKYYESL